jgi:Aspartyl/Asparaginyl beta-hydroxylase/Sulfotransferase domain
MGATSAEEIQRQHEQALIMIKTVDVAPCINHGEIPLEQKQVPTEQIVMETPAATDTATATAAASKPASFGIVCVSSRGRVNVTGLQNLIREGYNDPLAPPLPKPSQACFSPTNFWDASNAAANNVHITRPSHDAWGIKKIVLFFCDDFLQDVYELPWWHSNAAVRDAIQPILDCLQVAPSRVVRLLLAALPPGVTIPIHHDSGEWVKHTHRVHVPVLVTDPTKVVFTCGPIPTAVERVDCTPGHVFEMNNQAKHAVSNCGDDHRVHLILDYVNADVSHALRRIPLAPGERLIQTRRSIDRLLDKNKRPTPSYMILGAQKAGTTSLYEYMVQHPLVIRARRRETHCLDWRWNNFTNCPQKQRNHCLSFYMAKELQYAPSCLSGDSTPSYLLDSRRVIPRLQRIWNHPIQFIVMVRDPVKRAHSHYCMVTSPEGTPEQKQTRGTEWKGKTLMQVIELDLRKMQSCGLIPYWDIANGTMDQDVFDSFVGTPEEEEAWDAYMKDIPINTGSHSLITRGLYELQLRAWYRAFDRGRFLILKLEDLANEGVAATMGKVWKHLELPPYQVQDEDAKNTRSYTPMDDAVKAYLRAFYDPHNRRMKELMNGQEQWSNPWSYN